ncbi:MAG: hypothetical protein IPL92_01710 [Saprospiraceae bacterium]|nr:hypothetical protein [Candidatus Opimibacter iunctus]
MSKNKINLPTSSGYGDHAPQSEIFAVFRKGSFIDKVTNLPVELKEDALVRIIVPNYSILAKDFEQHLMRRKQLAFKKNETFYFNLHDSGYKFYVKNLQDIFATKHGNKNTRFSFTKCSVYKAEYNNKPFTEFVPFEAPSFNQAYIRVSERYKLGSGAHVCNVYTTFYHSDKGMIDYIREAII